MSAHSYSKKSSNDQSTYRNPAYFVWRDKNVSNSFNGSIFDDGQQDIECVTTTSAAIAAIKQHRQSHTVFVITNGGDQANAFVNHVRNILNIDTEIVVFCNAVDYHKTWARNYPDVSVFSGSNNLKQWVDKKRHLVNTYIPTSFLSKKSYAFGHNTQQSSQLAPNPYLDKSITSKFTANEDNKSYVEEKTKSYDLGGIDDEKSIIDQQQFKLTSNTDLRLDYNMKSSALPDESGFNVVPMDIYDTPKPVISFTLDQPYDSWTAEKERDFITKLAKELMVNEHELVVLCRSRGSFKFSVLVNAVKTQFHNIRVTCAYVQEKAKEIARSSTLKKYCIKSTQIKEWFTKKVKDNTKDMISAFSKMNINRTMSGMNKGEQWILNQSTALRAKLDDALKTLNGQYVVSAICILDNDKALQKFIQHPNLHQSRLLFHGTDLGALGSIYETGLKGLGGSVYGRGSYLTASPIHSINYMICYKSGKAKSGEYTLIAAYVNCGKIKQISDMSYAGKEIQSPYDSHYIASVASVADTKYLGYPTNRYPSYKGATANEYAIKDQTRILPRFYITLKIVQKDCFAYFTGKIVGDEFNDRNCISAAYKIDRYSECVGEGAYPRNREAFPNAVASTFDGIAIDRGTRVIIYEREYFQGRILLDQSGPAIINNVLWKNCYTYSSQMTKTFKPDLQKLYPQNRRFWSVSDMHPWSNGSVKVMRA